MQVPLLHRRTVKGAYIFSIYDGLSIHILIFWCTRAIEYVPQLLEPILDLIATYTGWKWTCVGGGPEPVKGGRLSMVRYVHVSLDCIFELRIY